MSSAPDIATAADWPERFRRAHGRAPRVLHVCNIANYAYVNATLMRRAGVDAVVLDPDFYHVASTPEWLDADLSGDHGDDFFPRWRNVAIDGFVRPEWFINGPTPFVFPELAAREAGAAGRRRVFAMLSRLYREGLASRKGTPSFFRRFMEGSDPASTGLKALLRRVTLRQTSPVTASVSSPIAVDPDTAAAAASLPPRVPVEVLRGAMAPFDVVIGYTLGARYAAAIGLPRVVSLELGTLRGLPFEDSDLGRICSWVYRVSPEVFVTNLDCLAPARRLGIPEERITPIPHPFDVDRALSFAAAPEPSPLAGDVPYFVCPARHHWRDGNASWLKGNDILIRGAAEAMAGGARFRLVMMEWGAEVELSRALIAELGLSEHVVWIRPLPRARLWPIMSGSVGVLDQFAATAFGGVGLEAMALGLPLVSRIAGVELGPFFSTPPPIRHAATPAEVAGEIRAILADPSAARVQARAGQDWMRTEHGVTRQLGLQFAACERLVARFGPAGT